MSERGLNAQSRLEMQIVVGLIVSLLWWNVQCWSTLSYFSGAPRPFRRVLSNITADSQSSKLPSFHNISCVGNISAGITPMLLFILPASNIYSSPLNPQEITVAGPFFQGWLVRAIDHSQNLSLIIICGSFSSAGSRTFTNHYAFCAAQSPAFAIHDEVFLPASQVTISRGSPGKTSLNVIWEAGNRGWFQFSDKSCNGKFVFTNGFEVEFDSTNRITWKGAENLYKKNSNDVSSCGPEGWLGSLFTSWLLPCHYFVHSVGSECTYRIVYDKRKVQEYNNKKNDNATTAGAFLRRLLHPRQWFSKQDGSGISGRNTAVEIAGKAFAHIEGNYGSSFPEGWIWAHSIAPDNTGSFSLALGKFSIAGFAPTNCIFYLRRRSGEILVFRTTDMDFVQHTVNGADGGTLMLNATSFLKNARVQVTITPQSKKGENFGITVHVPTAVGFSNKPGCVETYTAIATVRVFAGAVNASVAEEYTFPLSALEYGGTFIDKLFCR